MNNKTSIVTLFMADGSQFVTNTAGYEDEKNFAAATLGVYFTPGDKTTKIVRVEFEGEIE